MNNKELISELALRTGCSRANAQKMALAVMERLLSQVEESKSVQVPQFGTFEVKKRLERVLTNPNTGKKMLVPPKLVLNFKPVQAWKGRLAKGGTDDE